MLSSSNSEIRLSAPAHWWQSLLWDCVLSALMLWGALSALSAPLGSLAPLLLWPGAAAAAAWLLCAAADGVKKPWLAWLLRLLPWALMLPWTAEAVCGALAWVNCVLNAWNRLHRDALALFQVQAAEESVLAVSVMAAFALGALVYRVVVRRRLVLGGAMGLAVALLTLLAGLFTPLTLGVWLGALAGLWMSAERQTPPRQALRIWILCIAGLSICAFFDGEAELQSVTQLRRQTEQEVRALRYGSDTLPQGRLEQAYLLGQGETELLSVQTEQEKALYLRAFVGADYTGGVWMPLPGSAYGGIYEGMLSWLEEQGFDPLMQSAAYYALCDPESVPESNRLTVHVTGGTRRYLYLPATVGDISITSYSDDKDLRLLPSGLRGAELYGAEELSPTRPAELTVRADWVSAPQMPEQERYTNAEAVYRSFVYDNYAQPDASLAPLLEQMFWGEEYQPESDGIYSALDRIRTVLKQETTYDGALENGGETDDAADPLREFLLETRRGNAVLYASAAVEALRAHGIPARYVECYYLSASAAANSADGTVSLTGQDAHAWTEVYFDGIGWLPVDVTPGYYFDAVALRQMVARPDTVRKTAALRDGNGGGEDISALPEPAARPTPEPAVVMRSAALMLLGLMALFALALTAWFLTDRLVHLVIDQSRKRRYLRADAAERARLLEKWIYAALAAAGLDACLGWETAQTDAQAAEHFADVGAGEYTRAAALMEKFVYGGETPEPFELRTLQSFLQKVFAEWKVPKAWSKFLAARSTK